MRNAEVYLIPGFNHVEVQTSVLEIKSREDLNTFFFPLSRETE